MVNRIAVYIRVFSDILTSWIHYPDDEDGMFHCEEFHFRI